MTETKKNVLVGFTALAATACLLTLLLLFGYLPKFMEKGYAVRVSLPDAGGLYPGARVWYGGLSVGEVEAVERPDPLRPAVSILVTVQEDQVLPEGLSAYVFEPLIGGSPRLVLDLPAGVEPEVVLATDGSAVVHGRYLSSLAAMTGMDTSGLGDSLGGVEEALASIEQLAETWNTVGQQLAQITEPVSPDAVDAGDAEGNLASLMARADQRVAELQTVVEGADAFFNDEKMRQDIQTTVANTAEFSQNLDATSKRLEASLNESLAKLDAKVSGSMDDLTKQYGDVATELTATLKSYRQLADEARAGKGTAGLLIQDPSLYHNLNDATDRLQAAISAFQATLETWTEDGLPVKL